jgi:hypothetical protein
MNTTRDVQELVEWKILHEQYHKERLAEVKTIEAAYSERIRSGEIRDNEFDRKLDNLTHGITVIEQSAVTITSSLKKLQEVVNKRAGVFRW